jgi:hypothetical protein
MRNSLTAKNGPKTGLFGRKTRGARGKNDIFSRVFSVFRVVEAPGNILA